MESAVALFGVMNRGIQSLAFSRPRICFFLVVFTALQSLSASSLWCSGRGWSVLCLGGLACSFPLERDWNYLSGPGRQDVEPAWVLGGNLLLALDLSFPLEKPLSCFKLGLRPHQPRWKESLKLTSSAYFTGVWGSRTPAWKQQESHHRAAQEHKDFVFERQVTPLGQKYCFP